MPERIQRKRERGWRMPENTVYVGRPSKWGNPYQLADIGGGVPSIAVAYFRDMVLDGFAFYDKFKMPNGIYGFPGWDKELRGKNLACWCPLDQPCHADVLLELAHQ